ncbi:hypothetical protein P280DRAFT_277766 [Massarina eburnea CBS 473.64]|uniref:Uncharacterized protein n=1 Tax=Massarina eburnea CBS 473.64 TaxID=1395130 RepID=A0A6A6S6R6_9PLEO|nr:hypothetical protein P280DRAFT_277766 [Massarina eburnea CBS 473.64]
MSWSWIGTLLLSSTYPFFESGQVIAFLALLLLQYRHLLTGQKTAPNQTPTRDFFSHICRILLFSEPPLFYSENVCNRFAQKLAAFAYSEQMTGNKHFCLTCTRE